MSPFVFSFKPRSQDLCRIRRESASYNHGNYISLTASEQLELLSKGADGDTGHIGSGTYSGAFTSSITVIFDNVRKINVVTAASVK